MKRLIAFTLLSIVSISNLTAQDMSSVYSAWGFSAPFLKSGEFVLTGRGNYSASEYEYTYSNRPDYYSMSESSYNYLYFRGLIAISEKFLINTSFYYYPESENTSKYGDVDYDNKNTGKRKPYIYPYFTLIYRPIKNFEVSGTVYSYNFEQDYDYTYSNPDNEPYTYKYDGKSSGGSISVNYFGKLWNK